MREALNYFIIITSILMTLNVTAEHQETKFSPNQLQNPFYSENIHISHDEFDPSTMIAPLMPLSKDIPIEISFANQEKYILNANVNAQDSINTIQTIENKAIPWLSVLTTIILAIVITLIRVIPQKLRIQSTSMDTTPPNEKALNKLKQLEGKRNDPIEMTEYITQVDRVIREYMKDSFNINALALTTSEFMAKASKIDSLPPEAKQNLVRFLNATDTIKYAHHTPSTKEEMETTLLAHKIITQVTH